MNKFVGRKSVEHNDLITSVAKMDRTPLKIFSLAVSYIDTDNPPEDHTVYLSKKELFSFFNASDNDKHHRFNEAMDLLQKQSYFNVKQLKGKGVDYEKIVPIPYVKWNHNHDTVTIEFNKHIMPYLIDLKENFTQIDIMDLSYLNSKYAVILYKWLTMHYNQYENYKVKGNRTAKQLDDYKNPKISMEELRRITDTLEEHADFRNFEKWVLKKAAEEINQHTQLTVTYDKIKGGKFIKEIQFHIEKLPVAKNEFYKEEQQDPEFLLDEMNTEQAFHEAMNSYYTDVLADNMLLNIKDLRDRELMASLQKTVYPLYDELKQMQGMNGVRQHVSYVATNKKGYTKKNIGKYLRECIINYLPRARRQ